jgi:acetyl-CoA synthetase
MFEGVPNYPTPSRFWEIVDKHKVNILYTAPTAIRALMSEGDSFVEKTKRKTLRVLGSVGEPINPEAWRWYYNVVGNKECSIVDTWWQTETGGILIAPLVGAIDMKPGSATLPFFGIKPVIVDENNKELLGEAEGNLCIDFTWPGQMRAIYGDRERFVKTYFSDFPTRYFSGDGCRRDKDGYYWITGRVDDVINVSGHRIGTAEIESSLVLHSNVSEAAVVGYPHEIKGQGLYAFVTLNKGIKKTQKLEIELFEWVKKEIGSFAKPDFIQFTDDLPKTRSGKIMRRILRKISINEYEDLGDVSTLSDPSVVEELVKNRKTHEK